MSASDDAGQQLDPDQRIRVLIADDHRIFREGLRHLLESLSHVDVVGEAATGAEAVAAAATVQPDVVVMDLDMPAGGGIEATRTIVQHSPHIGVLVLTMYEDDASVFAAMRAGARGYLLKTAASRAEMLRGISAVAEGEAIFGPGIAHRVLQFFAGTRAVHSEPAFPELSARECEVLELIAAGLANQAIAHRLDITSKTVRNYVSNIFFKLQVADRAQAIIRARDAGMGR